MKSSFIFLLCISILISCDSNSAKAQMLVGKIEASVSSITTNKTSLLKNFNSNLLRLAGINGNFTEVNIVQDSSNYYLVFTGSAFRSSMILKPVKDASTESIYLYEGDGGGGNVTCTTSDCASEPRGCVPAPVGLACTPCANNGKCTKTVSSASMIF